MLSKETVSKLEEIMVCLECGSKLKYESNGEGKFKCTKCGKEYKIEDGIILMLDT